jgi:hypothetical protein
MELQGLDIAEHGMFGYPERFIEVPGAEPEEPHHARPSHPAEAPAPIGAISPAPAET